MSLLLNHLFFTRILSSGCMWLLLAWMHSIILNNGCKFYANVVLPIVKYEYNTNSSLSNNTTYTKANSKRCKMVVQLNVSAIEPSTCHQNWIVSMKSPSCFFTLISRLLTIETTLKRKHFQVVIIWEENTWN